MQMKFRDLNKALESSLADGNAMNLRAFWALFEVSELETTKKHFPY